MQDRFSFVTDLGKLLIFLGGMIVLVGLGLVLAGRANFPLGRLPGILCIGERTRRFIFRSGRRL